MTISVIIPVLNEQQRINRVISDLRQLEPDTEIIVVDGDPTGSTLQVIVDSQVACLTVKKGRGNQLAAGAEFATGEILLMLHADTLLPDNAFQAIFDAISNGADWGAFRLGIKAPNFLYRVIELMVDLRCKLFALPYGDQAIFVVTSVFQKAGGIPAIPLMEDVELARRLHRAELRFRLLSEQVQTSPRRWQKDGIIRRTFKNWWLLLCYLCGAAPEKLAREYETSKSSTSLSLLK